MNYKAGEGIIRRETGVAGSGRGRPGVWEVAGFGIGFSQLT